MKPLVASGSHVGTQVLALGGDGCWLACSYPFHKKAILIEAPQIIVIPNLGVHVDLEQLKNEATP